MSKKIEGVFLKMGEKVGILSLVLVVSLLFVNGWLPPLLYQTCS